MKPKTEEQLKREIRRLRLELKQRDKLIWEFKRLRKNLEEKLKTAEDDREWFNAEIDKLREDLNDK